MNASPHHLAQSEMSPANSGTLQATPGQIIRPVLNRGPVTVSSPVSASANSSGRVLPVVYLKMPQREQVVPVVSRSGNIISTIGTKISSAPSGNLSAISGSQSSYVTIQGPIRSVAQTTSVQQTQPHIITLPKVANTLALSNQQLIALQSVGGANQSSPVQQQQYVTIQAPIVSKTQQNPAIISGGQLQPQYVTIRTPVLTGSGTTTSSHQSQYVTLQAPVVPASGQTSQSHSTTYLPVSSIGQTSLGQVKSPVTYQVLKSNKTGEQQIVYPVSVSNVIPASQSKMLFTPVSMVPKVSVVPAGSTSISAQASSDLVSSPVTMSGIKLNTNAQYSTKILNSSSVNFSGGKSLQTVSFRKEGIILPSTDGSTSVASQQKVVMPIGVPVSNPSSTNPGSQGFINLTISNGHIQPSSSKVLVQGNHRIEKKSKDPASSSEFHADLNTVPPKSTLTESSGSSAESAMHSQTLDGQSSGKSKSDDTIDVTSLLRTGSSPNIDSSQPAGTSREKDINSTVQKSDGNSGEQAMIDGISLMDGMQTPSSPINLFCEEGDLAHSPPNDTSAAKYTITMSDNPDEDIKIQLVKNSGLNCEKDSAFNNDEGSKHSLNSSKNVMKKSSPKLLSKGSSSSKGQSLLRNPAALPTVSSPKASKPSNKSGSKSILKPQGGRKSELRPEGSDAGVDTQGDSLPLPGEPKDSLDTPSSPLTPSSFEDFDVVAALKWKQGIGHLPGSSLKFRMNEFGLMEMVSDEDAGKKGTDKDTNSDSEGLMIDEGSNSSLEGKPNLEVKEKKESTSDDVYCCETCGVYGLASEFLSERFCTEACSAAFTVKKAWQYRREQDLRALRLRRKKKRLEQQRLAREKAEQEMGNAEGRKGSSNNSSKLIKKIKTSPDSDADDSMEDPFSVDSHMPSSPSSSYTSSDKLPGLHHADDDPGRKFARQRSASNFTWSKYLETVKAKSAPCKLFKVPFPFGKNGFKVGMKLEGIDPEHPACFCVLTVAEVKGYRLRLHFDGYPDNYDFWVNADSPDIFQAGWCEKNMRKLMPPKGQSNFNWNSYLKMCKAIAAPKLLFSSKSSASSVCPNGFRVGMKLEAVDKKNSSLVCVASIADIVDGRCLIHFDSWDDIYNYWADPSSPYIHPIGWCDEHGVTLVPPIHYKEPRMFSWDKYLKETRSTAAPARAFKQRQPNCFKRGMRLEAVDKRVPHLIRVATVDDVHDHSIRIRFDGWPDEFSYWVDDDSPDIHPVGWCLETKHPLEPPLSEEDMKVLARCGIAGCKGEGNIKGPRYTGHSSAHNCPYAPENIHVEYHLPDRLTSSNDNVDLEDSPKLKSSSERHEVQKLTPGPPRWKRLLHGSDDRECKRPKFSDDDDEFCDKPAQFANIQQKLQSELERSVIDPGYQIETGPGRPALWVKHSQPLHDSPMVRDAVNPQSWTIEDVLEFLASIPCLEEYGRIFKEQDIDGEALLMLTQNELVSNMKLKLGHAIRLYNCIVILRQKCI